MSGFFMVVEGPEGAGKTTLTRALAERFRHAGVEPTLVREPGGTPAAEALRNELLNGEREWTPEAELLYIAAARADLVAKVIRPALAAGRVVLSDRFDLSTIAYQVAGRGLPRLMVDWINHAATGGLVPHLILVLDIPADLGRVRQLAAGKTLDRLDREPAGFHARVAAAYQAAAGPSIRHLDATGTSTDVLDQAWAVVREEFARSQAGAPAAVTNR
jgi:dTMP kinase